MSQIRLPSVCIGKNAILLALVCCRATASTASVETSNDEGVPTQNKDETSYQCRLWLGPSYLTSDSSNKYGLYAGVDFNEGDIIPDYEIGLPLIDFVDNPAGDFSAMHRATVEYLEALMWSTDYVAQAKYEANNSATAYVPGVGMLTNYHSGYYNVEWHQLSVLAREPYLPSQQASPARGSISPYYNLTMRASKKIPAGMELFANYGDAWDSEQSGDGDDIYQQKLTRQDYEIADKVVNRILDFFDKFEETMSADLREKVLDFMCEQVLDGTAGKRAKVYRSIIPTSIRKLKAVKQAGGTFVHRYGDMIRSQQWLEKNALCVDYLEVKPSTVEHAGRGAFARRSFEKGEVITPVPLVPVPTEELFHLYKPMDIINNGDIGFDTSTPIGFQQILNYAFGHPESTLRLIPTSPMVSFVNHAPSSKRYVGKGTIQATANAYLEWSDHDTIYNDHSLHDIPISDWTIADVPSIVMTLKAKRPIQSGEEIFIDYGQDWEQAWNSHLEYWSEQYPYSVPSKWPRKAADTAELYKDQPFPIRVQIGMKPYPTGVVTACFLIDSPTDPPDGQPHRNSLGNDILIWQGPPSVDGLRASGLNVCDLIDRKPLYNVDNMIVSYNYTILTRLKDQTDSQNLVQVENVPHYAVTFVDRPYTSDIYATGAFRHWIGIDDKIFPQAWRNLR